MASAKFDDVTADGMIEAAVKQWRRTAKGPRKYSEEIAAIMSEACRGRTAPAVCVRMLRNATRKDRYILRRHEEILTNRFSATYLRIQRLAEEKEFYTEVSSTARMPDDGSGMGSGIKSSQRCSRVHESGTSSGCSCSFRIERGGFLLGGAPGGGFRAI